MQVIESTNTKFLDALNCINSGRPPIWLMRQAGRYMPQYRALRQQYSFLEMCHQPELILQITKMPIEAFDLDAAIVFSDILVTAESLEVGLTFEENKGPIILNPMQQAEDVEKLKNVDVIEKLGYVAHGIKLLKKELKVPLIGFCGAPFTVASYMIEGGSSHDWKKVKKWLIQDPTSFQLLLDKVLKVTLDYVNLQIDAGVDAIQIFDTWANILSWNQFEVFSNAYLKKIVDAVKARNVPVIVFCKNSSSYLSLLKSIQPSAISLDSQCDLRSIRRAVPFDIALQGNLDPDVLYGNRDSIEKEVTDLLTKMHGDQGFIFNLSHGIKPDIPYESVQFLIETVKNKFCEKLIT